MNSNIAEIFTCISQGQPPSANLAKAVLQAQGSHLTLLLSLAHYLKELHWDHKVELCSIINAKSGRCSENCSFCAQSVHHNTQAPVFPLKSTEEIVNGAKQAEAEGSHCYGIVTSGTRVNAGEEFDRILSSIQEIRRTTGIEPSASLGILDPASARALVDAGCVTYHHNLETARSFFPNICSTHDYEEDVQTVLIAKDAGLKVCSGGIFGLGESLEQRYELAETLSQLDVDSVPLNFLNPIPGTPLECQNQLTPLDCIRIIALFRMMLPSKRISVCGGREHNLREFQSWMFMAGASGTMVGNYLTTNGRNRELDIQMLLDAEVLINVCR